MELIVLTPLDLERVTGPSKRSEPSLMDRLSSLFLCFFDLPIFSRLPLSVLEGRLKTAFAHFGEVLNILLDKKTRKPFGSAYVWFACSEEAELAAKEMNGKFLDGRFISVKLAIPGSCKSQVQRIPYKF
ncbi:hypothetical protein DCAR_0519159 [Daucus carota subsp. sativus]|uniref:RRM domain-containing protein n=1 Tax=Daucus carota subsp. sativus TaxID=79200 RepID=A0AAF0X3M4_DAUCS|nr:hypothetical protein DCAR_0519159 [Daucus carota subsp. sativus]